MREAGIHDRADAGRRHRFLDAVGEALTGEITPEAAPDAFAVTRRLAFDGKMNLTDHVFVLARDNARQVREALSIEVWEKLNRLYLRLAPVTMDSIWCTVPPACSARRWKTCTPWKG